MVQGALFVPEFARAHCHGDGTPIRPGASGRKAAADVLPGVSQYPHIAADLQAPVLGGQREREPACRACQALNRRYGVNRDTLARSAGWDGRLADASADAARKVSTFHSGRSSTTELNPAEHSR